MKRGFKPLPWDLPPDYLGREHFMEFGEFHAQQTIRHAQTAFSRLTAHAVFPHDNRYVDYENHGLVVVPRVLVDMPPVPDWAEFERSSQSKRQEQYAIGTVSLIDCFDRGVFKLRPAVDCSSQTLGKKLYGFVEVFVGHLR